MGEARPAAEERRHFALATRSAMYTRSQHDKHAVFQALLSRVFSSPGADKWRVQGGLALFARLPGLAPSPTDVDFAYRTHEQIEESVSSLDRALYEGRGNDSFDITVRVEDAVRSHTSELMIVPMNVLVPGREKFTITVDVVAMPLELDQVEELPLTFAPTGTHRRVLGKFLPVAGEIAQKTCAMITWRAQPDGPLLPSTRHKTLVGLYPLMRFLPSSFQETSEWLFATAASRAMVLPSHLVVNDHLAWKEGYERVRTASRPARMYPRFDNALEYANEFLTPILNNSASGVWHPYKRQWQGEKNQRALITRRTLTVPPHMKSHRHPN